MIRVALVCQGLQTGGGVPTAARWLRDTLGSLPDFQLDVHDLATSSRDPASRLLRRPATWRRSSLRHPADTAGVTHWGANAVELEPMRYLPRGELTQVLASYDVVHVVAGGPALGYVANRAGRPVVLQMATFARWEREAILASWSRPARLRGHVMTALTGRIEAKAVRSASAVLVLNDHLAAAVRRLGQPRVEKAPLGVDTGLFRPRPEGWTREGYLLSVGRLGEPRKGLDRLILAYDCLTRHRNDVPPLVLAGKGRLSHSVVDLIGELNLTSRVSVRNDIAPDQLPDLYRGASIFVQTSHEEGLGLASIEAMASGLPVVATECAGSREVVVDDVTGWLVPQRPTNDVPAGVASRLSEALEHGAELGAAGRYRAEDVFSTRATLQLYVDTYHRLLTG